MLKAPLPLHQLVSQNSFSCLATWSLTPKLKERNSDILCVTIPFSGWSTSQRFLTTSASNLSLCYSNLGTTLAPFYSETWTYIVLSFATHHRNIWALQYHKKSHYHPQKVFHLQPPQPPKHGSLTYYNPMVWKLTNFFHNTSLKITFYTNNTIHNLYITNSITPTLFVMQSPFPEHSSWWVRNWSEKDFVAYMKPSAQPYSVHMPSSRHLVNAV
jgi:hypothetical protein